MKRSWATPGFLLMLANQAVAQAPPRPPEEARAAAPLVRLRKAIVASAHDGSYRLEERSSLAEIEAEKVGELEAAVAHLEEELRLGRPLPELPELVAEWETHSFAGWSAEAWAQPRRRDLYVHYTSGCTIETFYNTEDELDYTTVWTPDLRILHNPGREQLSFQFQPSGSVLQGLDQLTMPLTPALNEDDGIGVTREETGGVERFTFQKDQAIVVVEAVSGLPRKVITVDGRRAVIAAQYRHGPSEGGDGRFVLREVRRIELFLHESHARLEYIQSSLSDFRLSPDVNPKIEVRATDNVFEASPNGVGSKFLGQASRVQWPPAIAAFVNVTDEPRVLWRR